MYIEFSHFLKNEFIEALEDSLHNNLRALNIIYNSLSVHYNEKEEIVSFRIKINLSLVRNASLTKDYINETISLFGNTFGGLFGLDFSKLIEIHKDNDGSLQTTEIEVCFLYRLTKEEKDILYTLLKVQGYMKPATIFPSTMLGGGGGFASCANLTSITFPKNLFYNTKI